MERGELAQLLQWPFYGGLLALAAVLYLTLDLLKRSRGNATMIEISSAIQLGAKAFLRREYLTILWFILGVFALLALAEIWKPRAGISWQTGAAFVIGAICSALAGALGLAIATRANGRTTEAARDSGIKGALDVAISGGAVMGLGVAGISLLGLCLVILIFRAEFDIINGYALGASLMALFARAGGGIYNKGADMGADLVGKVESGIPEDDPRNAATIADNVGDNVGGVTGMGLDLMESLEVAVIAAMTLVMTMKFSTSTRLELMMLPLVLAGWGAVCSIIGVFFVRAFVRLGPQNAMMSGIGVAALLAAAGSWFSVKWLGHDMTLLHGDLYHKHTPTDLFWAVLTGLIAGNLIGLIFDYYTASRYRHARRIAEHSRSGAALTVIEGLAVGMHSCAVPTMVLAAVVVMAYYWAGFYGMALAAVGMLMTTGIVAAVNAYGPIADNAGGIAGMSRQDHSIREITNNLDAVGNTMTAIGKGFAIAAATLASLALLMAYLKIAKVDAEDLALNDPRIVGGLLLGGMFPYFFSSMLFRAVSRSAFAMIGEVRKQLREIPGIMEGKARPDYARCVDIATKGALGGMLLPGGLAIVLPPAIGFALGKELLAGFLIGALISGLMLGIQMPNSGGAMDNAKKFIEEGNFGGKGSEAHKAAVVGDTLGDPLKDTVGPSINILIKLMCVIALVIAPLLA